MLKPNGVEACRKCVCKLVQTFNRCGQSGLPGSESESESI